MRTSPGGTNALKRTYDGEIEAPTLVPSHRHAHTHTHTHLRIHNQKKGVSENEAPGPVGAYTTTHNNTPTPMLNRCQISFTECHPQN